MAVKPYKRNLFQRLLGISQTREPQNADCWKLEDGRVSVELGRAPELAENWGAIRLESKELPRPLLVMRDGEGRYRAFGNKCTHAGRRLDPVPDTVTLCCCSVGKSTFDYEGKVLSGGAKGAIDAFDIEVQDERLLIRV